MSALDRLFRPSTVAVVGASPSAAKAGHQLLLGLAAFPGEVYPINPRASEVAGRAAYPSVTAVGAPVDLALLAVPPAALLDALRDCAASGVGAAVIHAGGLAEAGAEGAALQTRLTDFARDAGVRLLGPNTSGFVVPEMRLHATFVPGVGAIAPGPLAIVAQSGGVNHQLAFAAHAAGIGVRLAVGLGNAADIDVPDVLEQLADDPATGAVALALEGVRDGRRLMAAVERLSERVPVIALKAGRTDVGAFAQSHTGALTGSWRVARAGLAQAGAVVVERTDELLDAARALLCGRIGPREAPGVGVVTGQAGPGLLLADELGVLGERVPELSAGTLERLGTLLDPITYQRNPVDTGRPGPGFREVVAAVAADPQVDALLVHGLLEPGALDPVAALAGASESPVVFSTGGPPVAVADVSTGLASVGIATYASPERAARAVAALTEDARRAWNRRERSRGGVGAPHEERAELTGPWDEASAKQLAASFGVAIPAGVVCADRAAAHAALARLRAPLAVKLVHSELRHKSERGALRLGIGTAAELDDALDALEAVPGLPGARVLVEEMAPSGPELLVGAIRDPAFGAVVVLGAGGVAAEVLDDVAVRVAPVAAREATTMIDELATAAQLRGFRGQPAVDERELGAILANMSRWIAARPGIAEIELNPLRATAQGLVALDALVVPA